MKFGNNPLLKMDVLQAIKERRSIRKFQPRDVPDELIRDILEAAQYAPSSKNTQPWEFIIIRDSDTKSKLADLTLYGKFIDKAPVLIAVVTDPRKSSFHIIDGACAVQNMMLAAWGYGLGTCWIGTMDREKAKEILGIPDHLHLLTVIPIGYPAEKPLMPERKKIDEVIHYERY